MHKKDKDMRIGVTLTNDHGHPMITDVAGPPALAHGLLFVGDIITTVNEWSAAGHSETTARLKRSRGRIVLKVMRQAR